MIAVIDSPLFRQLIPPLLLQVGSVGADDNWPTARLPTAPALSFAVFLLFSPLLFSFLSIFPPLSFFVDWLFLIQLSWVQLSWVCDVLAAAEYSLLCHSSSATRWLSLSFSLSIRFFSNQLFGRQSRSQVCRKWAHDSTDRNRRKEEKKKKKARKEVGYETVPNAERRIYKSNHNK